jgi:hypothetical protein
MFLSPQTVSAEDESFMDLSIIYPLQVNESFSFNVAIKSNNVSLDNVTVTFDGKINRTNSLGIAGFVAPRVLPDGENIYAIIALKEGYNATIVNITVVNVLQVLPTVSTLNLAEETSFVVTAMDDEGRVVYNATIAFNGKEYLSSINGAVTLATPSVNKSKAYIISATKPGYIDYSIVITVYPSLSPENLVGFFIVIIICILIVIVTFIIMLRKYLRRKRINRL